MIEVKKDVVSVWVLQPKIKIDLREIDISNFVDEANSLAKALPAVKIIGSTVVPIERLRPKEFFGAGKVNELAVTFKSQKIDLVIINYPISPVQQKNLEQN